MRHFTQPRLPHPQQQLRQKPRRHILLLTIPLRLLHIHRSTDPTPSNRPLRRTGDSAAISRGQWRLSLSFTRSVLFVPLPERVEGDNLLGDGCDEREGNVQLCEEGDWVLGFALGFRVLGRRGVLP